MIEEIKLLIEKTLPVQTAGVLRDYLEKAEKLEDLLKEKDETIDRQKDEISKLRTEKMKWECLNERESKLDAREKTVAERENAMWKSDLETKMKTAELKAEEAEKRAELVSELAQTVFSNPRLSYREQGSMPIAVPSSQYGHGFVQSSAYDKTVIQEETK